MYILYYLNRNLQLGTINVQSLDVPVLIPEDLIFCDLRKGISFIKEPHKCIGFTDLERLIMQSDFNDVSLIKDGDFRMQNTYLEPLCEIDPMVLKIKSANEVRVYVTDIQEEVMKRIYTCSSDIFLAMHIISKDGKERVYENLNWMSLEYDRSVDTYYVAVIEPFEIVKIWFRDQIGDYSNSNVYTVIPVT